MEREFTTKTPTPLLLRQYEADELHVTSLTGDAREKVLYRGPDEAEASRIFEEERVHYGGTVEGEGQEDTEGREGEGETPE